MKKKGSTTTNLQKRRNQLVIILSRFHAEGKHPTLQALKKELKKLRVEAELSTISEDLKEINRKNTFVKDLAQYHYSSLCESHLHNMIWIYAEAKKQYQQSEDAKAKNAFLNTMMTAQTAIQEAINGKMMDVSVAMIQNEFTELSLTIPKKVRESIIFRNSDSFICTISKIIKDWIKDIFFVMVLPDTFCYLHGVTKRMISLKTLW
jgi:hypothetical protein